VPYIFYKAEFHYFDLVMTSGDASCLVDVYIFTSHDTLDNLQH